MPLLDWWSSAAPKANATAQPSAGTGGAAASSEPQQRSVPVVQATVVQQGSRRPSGAAETARPPPPPEERVPAVPNSFQELAELGDVQLDILNANTAALDDLLVKTQQGRSCTNRVKELRQETHDLAAEILALEERRESVVSRCQTKDAGTAQLRQNLDALRRQRDEILAKRSPERIAAALKARADAAEAEAENLLNEALDSTSTMDSAALAKFKQRFLEQKAEKHWRLAVTEAVTSKPLAAEPVFGA